MICDVNHLFFRRIVPVVLLAGLVSVTMVLGVLYRVEPIDTDAAESWSARQQHLAGHGAGFVVWESNRTRAWPDLWRRSWRIWKRNLDGSGLTQLTPPEWGRNHFCPHLSPDGRNLLYLSYPRVISAYVPKPPDVAVPLHLLDLETGRDRILVDDVRSYYEDRAAVWVDQHRFNFIAANGDTEQFDLRTGERRKLVTAPTSDYGWLLNASHTSATTGEPSFSGYNVDRRVVVPKPKKNGCQPYFSHDGRWGFWIGGMGGPIKRMHLASRTVSTVVEKDDTRLPSDRRYLYFPMLSSNSRLMTFSGSGGDHYHFEADYDVFVGRMDPATLELLEPPVRYTFSRFTDRFPDVHQPEPELGWHSGEAPFEVELVPPAGGDEGWSWDFGDGAVAKGPSARHRYITPGDYTLKATRDGQALTGFVRVRPAVPPQVLSVETRGTGVVTVAFDEPVEARVLEARLDSGGDLMAWELAQGGEILTLRFSDRPRQGDRLFLKGIVDRAQKPNSLATDRLAIRNPEWPWKREGLVFLFQTADRKNLVRDPTTGALRAYPLEARGEARLSHHFALLPSLGSFVSEEAGRDVAESWEEHRKLSIEATVTPLGTGGEAPGVIMAVSAPSGAEGFALLEKAGNLVVALQSACEVENRPVEVPIGPVPMGRPSHIALVFADGQAVAYVNGKEVHRADGVGPGLPVRSDATLSFGVRADGTTPWRGAIEGVAIYRRALDPGEVNRNSGSYRALTAARRNVPRIVVEAELTGLSELPTLKQITPYRKALVVHEYRVRQAEERGIPRIRVAHWAILDGKTLAISTARRGQVRNMRIEAFGDNPQLESVFRSNTLGSNAEVPLFYAVDEET